MVSRNITAGYGEDPILGMETTALAVYKASALVAKMMTQISIVANVSMNAHAVI